LEEPFDPLADDPFAGAPLTTENPLALTTGRGGTGTGGRSETARRSLDSHTGRDWRLTTSPKMPLDLLGVQRLLLEQLLDEPVQDRAVLDEDLPRLVVRGLDEPADLAVDRRGDGLRVVALVAHVAPEEHLPRALPSLIAPISSLMPNCVTILRASPVAFSMSFAAPEVGSWKTSSSATRPPRA
jgi:hypothetical protein